LIATLVQKGDFVRAKKALDYCLKVIPAYTVPHDYTSIQLADSYYRLHDYAKGNEIMDAVAKNSVEYLDWYAGMSSTRRNSVQNRIGHNMAVLQQVLKTCDEAKQKSILNKYYGRFVDFSNRFQMQ
jgi:hypothetical protein